MYATLSDLEKRLAPQTIVELADDDSDGIADAAVVDAVLADAAAAVDLFLAARYATPVASPPALLTRLAADLAIHALFGRRRSAVSPDHAERYAEATRILSEIASGKMALPGAEPRRLAGSTRMDDAKVFSSESMEEF